MKMFIFMGVIYFMGLYKFCVKSEFLLKILLSLEFMNLILFFCLYIVVWINLEKYILMFYLTFCVCEGAFGLSLLVLMIRSKGNDFFQSLNFLKC